MAFLMISQLLNRLLELQIHSRNQKVGSGCDIILWYLRKIRSLIALFHCRYHQAYPFNNPYRDVEYRGAIEVRNL
jgi:hypothetical protein